MWDGYSIGKDVRDIAMAGMGLGEGGLSPPNKI